MKKAETFKHFCWTNSHFQVWSLERNVILINKMCGSQWGYPWSFIFQVQQKVKWPAFKYLLGVLKEYKITIPFRHHKTSKVFMSFIFSLKHFVHTYIIPKYSLLKTTWEKYKEQQNLNVYRLEQLHTFSNGFLTVSVSLITRD